MRSTSRRRRSTLATAALAAALLVVAGCGGGTTPASSTSSTSAPSSSSTTTSTTPPSTVSSTHCRTENLRGSLGESESGAGQRYTALVLTNVGSTTCDLRGFPGVSLLDASGTQIGAPAGREGTAGSSVSIPAGGTASATLHTSTAGTGGSCTGPSAKLRVYPPDNTAALEFAASFTACGTFVVTTVVAGSSGR